MPTYTYTAKLQPQKTIQGKIEAESEQEAINKLNKIGYFPISIKAEEASLEKQSIFRFWKVSKKDTVLFTRQFSSLIHSGVNILSGLNTVAIQTSNKYLRAILNDAMGKIKDGKPLSDSFAMHPYLFPPLYTSIIRSGEASGNIEQAMDSLADFLEKEEEFKNSVRGALVYPAFVIFVSTITVIILLTFVIPRLVSMFEDMGQVLPLPTKILINLSGFLRSWWWFILAVGFIFIFLLRRLYHRPQGKIRLDKLKLKLPVWGKVVLKTEISRLTRTLSLLIASGIPILHSLEVTITVIENQILKLEVEKFKEQIASGLRLSQCLGDSKLFPVFVTNIVTVGEETGSLEKSLMRIADDYEKEVDRALKGLTRLLEPLIVLAMGLVVGFIVLSMLLPIFQINLIAK